MKRLVIRTILLVKTGINGIFENSGDLGDELRSDKVGGGKTIKIWKW